MSDVVGVNDATMNVRVQLVRLWLTIIDLLRKISMFAFSSALVSHRRRFQWKGENVDEQNEDAKHREENENRNVNPFDKVDFYGAHTAGHEKTKKIVFTHGSHQSKRKWDFVDRCALWRSLDRASARVCRLLSWEKTAFLRFASRNFLWTKQTHFTKCTPIATIQPQESISNECLLLLQSLSLAFVALCVPVHGRSSSLRTNKRANHKRCVDKSLVKEVKRKISTERISFYLAFSVAEKCLMSHSNVTHFVTLPTELNRNENVNVIRSTFRARLCVVFFSVPFLGLNRLERDASATGVVIYASPYPIGMFHDRSHVFFFTLSWLFFYSLFSSFFVSVCCLQLSERWGDSEYRFFGILPSTPNIEFIFFSFLFHLFRLSNDLFFFFADDINLCFFNVDVVFASTSWMNGETNSRKNEQTKRRNEKCFFFFSFSFCCPPTTNFQICSIR